MLTDLVECRLCPWRIETTVDGWEHALDAHLQHHQDLEEGNVMAKCKVDGCDNDAASTRGMYALLCDEHKLAKQHSSPPATNGHVSLEELGRAVDEALRRFDESVAELRKAIDRAGG